MIKPLSKYAQAEIMEPPGAKVPEKIAPYLRAFYIERAPVKLRVLLTREPETEPRGTIIISPGRTEFIEKYLELAEDLINRRFAVLIIDHRGQGLSSRLLDDPLKSYVKQFQDYADDLGYVIDELDTHLPKPHIVMAHSMGGCIALQSVISGTINPAAMICSAPMLGVYDIEAPLWRWFFKTLSALGMDQQNIPFSRQTNGLPVAFENNKLTSDPVRFQRWAAYFTHIEPLRLAGPTIGWITAALGGMKYVNRNAAQVKTPTLIISAGADSIVDPSSHKAFARTSGARLKVVPGARHELIIEMDKYRNQFLDIVDSYLEANAL